MAGNKQTLKYAIVRQMAAVVAWGFSSGLWLDWNQMLNKLHKYSVVVNIHFILF